MLKGAEVKSKIERVHPLGNIDASCVKVKKKWLAGGTGWKGCIITRNIRIYALGTMNIQSKSYRNSANSFWDDLSCFKALVPDGCQGWKKSLEVFFFLTGDITLYHRSRVVVNVICENHLCLLLFIFWGGGRVLLPLGAVLFFGVIHSHGCCKKQLWPSTISNSLCNFGHTIDESCAEELRRPEKAQQW